MFTRRILGIPLITGPRDINVLNRRILCLAPCGACALYRKDLLERLGGFDEDFISDWEDHDLGYRIWLSGYVCIHIPNVTIEHYGSASYGEFSYRGCRRIIRNYLATYFKNLNTVNLFLIFPVVFLHKALTPFISTLSNELKIIKRKLFKGYYETSLQFLLKKQGRL